MYNIIILYIIIIILLLVSIGAIDTDQLNWTGSFSLPKIIIYLSQGFDGCLETMVGVLLPPQEVTCQG